MPRAVREACVRAAYPVAVLVMMYGGCFAARADRSADRGADGSAAAAVARPPTLDATRALVERAAALMHEGRYEDALVPVRTLHEIDSRSQVYDRQLADIARHLRKPQDEARYLEEFVRVSPTPLEACPRLGEVYWEQGLSTQSVAAYERCLTFDDHDPDAVFYLARAYEWNQRYDDARRLYERGLELDSQYLDMHLGLARVDLHLGHTADARARALEVLGQAPQTVDAMLVVGLSFQREGNAREARKYLEQGLTIKEDYADVHLALGILDEEDNHVQQAMQHYTRSVALDQRNTAAQARRDRLEQRLRVGVRP